MICRYCGEETNIVCSCGYCNECCFKYDHEEIEEEIKRRGRYNGADKV
jgi:hypothetical protein